MEYLDVLVTRRGGTPGTDDVVEVGLTQADEPTAWHPATWQHVTGVAGRYVYARALIDTTTLTVNQTVTVRITAPPETAIRHAGTLRISTDQTSDHPLYAMF